MLEVNFTPFPELTTERLVLRKVSVDDAPEIYFLRSDPEVLKYLGKDPEKSVDTAKNFINLVNGNMDNNDSVLWGIALKDDPSKLIGTICYWRMQKEHYRAEIGYVLHPGYWRKGYMKEAIGEVVNYAFNLMGLHSIEARLSPENIASAASLEANGFTKDALFKEDFYYNGEFLDTLVYSLVNKKK